MHNMNTIHFLKDNLGWLAMTAFAASYLCKTATALRRAQAGAAALWILYGVTTGAMPVVVSNAVVAFMAVVFPVVKDWLETRARGPEGSAADHESAPKRETTWQYYAATGQPFGC